MIYTSLLIVVALLHLYFWYAEAILWSTPKGQKIFNTTAEFARDSKVLAANQGLYNGLLALGLLASLFLGPAEKLLQQYILAFIVVAGVYGGFTVTRKIILLQAVPAAIAFVLSLC